MSPARKPAPWTYATAVPSGERIGLVTYKSGCGTNTFLCPSSIVQEQDAGAGVLRRHSVRQDQVLTVERPVDAPPKHVVLRIRFPDLAFGSTQGGDEVVSASTRACLAKEGDVP